MFPSTSHHAQPRFRLLQKHTLLGTAAAVHALMHLLHMCTATLLPVITEVTDGLQQAIIIIGACEKGNKAKSSAC